MKFQPMPVNNDFYRQALELDLRSKREYTEAILSAMGGIEKAQFSRIKSLLRLSDEALELADRHDIEEKKLRYVVALPTGISCRNRAPDHRLQPDQQTGQGALRRRRSGDRAGRSARQTASCCAEDGKSHSDASARPRRRTLPVRLMQQEGDAAYCACAAAGDAKADDGSRTVS